VINIKTTKGKSDWKSILILLIKHPLLAPLGHPFPQGEREESDRGKLDRAIFGLIVWIKNPHWMKKSAGREEN
jgi:hypothetical protein